MHRVPRSPIEALAIYRDPGAEDWERDYAATMIAGLAEGRVLLLETARNPDEDGMLQQRAASCLGNHWWDRDELMTADISGFTPVALDEILAFRNSYLTRGK